jgi:hypothetical protein
VEEMQADEDISLLVHHVWPALVPIVQVGDMEGEEVSAKERRECQ